MRRETCLNIYFAYSSPNKAAIISEEMQSFFGQKIGPTSQDNGGTQQMGTWGDKRRKMVSDRNRLL